MNVKIAAVQMQIGYLDIDANLERAFHFLEVAHKNEADFVVFPELFITGTTSSKVKEVADTIPGRYTSLFSKYAEEYGFHIIMGSIYERYKNVFYNSTPIIDDHGSLIGVYRKNKLWITEKENISSSSDRPVFNTRYCKIGVNICWDIAFPEVSRTIAKKGAKIIFAPVNWSVNDFTPPPYTDEVLRTKSNIHMEQLFVNTMALARAIENNVFFVLVNGHGSFETRFGPRTFIGQTQITAPLYGVLYRAENKEAVLIGEIDLNLLEVAEEKYHLIADSD